MEEGDTGLATPGGGRPRGSQSQRQRDQVGCGVGAAFLEPPGGRESTGPSDLPPTPPATLQLQSRRRWGAGVGEGAWGSPRPWTSPSPSRPATPQVSICPFSTQPLVPEGYMAVGRLGAGGLGQELCVYFPGPGDSGFCQTAEARGPGLAPVGGRHSWARDWAPSGMDPRTRRLPRGEVSSRHHSLLT